MSSGLPRELLKWLLGLDLSYPVKNVKRDFANGFLFAEILSRYYPADMPMHSFENVASTERKKKNWSLLEKFFKKQRIPVERQQIEAVMASEGEAACEVLQTLHSFVTSSAAAEDRNRGFEASPSSSNYHQQNGSYIPQPQQPSQHFFPPTQQQQHSQQPQYAGGYQSPAYGSSSPVPGYGSSSQTYQPLTAMGAASGAGVGATPGLTPHQLYMQQYVQQYMQQQQYGGAGEDNSSDAYQQQQQQQQAQQRQRASPARLPRQQQQQRAGAQANGSATGNGYSASVAGASPALQLQQVQHQQLAYQQQQQQAYLLQQQQQGMYVMTGYQPIGVGLGGQDNSYAGVGGMYGQNLQDYSSQQQQAPTTNIPFSKPRPVEFQPYEQSDYDDKDYSKKSKYLQLGKLGPDLDTEELQAKRGAKERLKQYAAAIQEENLKKAAVTPPRKPAVKELSARDKALQFSKSVPKPEVRPKAPTCSVASNEVSEAPKESELEILERQHQADRARVDAVRAQLGKLVA